MTSDRQDQARALRDDGASFGEIGRALGVTRQRAQQLCRGNRAVGPQVDPRVLAALREDGRRAAANGLDRSDCQWPPGSWRGVAWRIGYDDEMKRRGRL